jgi:Uma2 family endonuclease
MAQRIRRLEVTPNNARTLYAEVGALPVDEDAYLGIALDDPDTKWELHDGLLWEKPGMTFDHFGVATVLANHLTRQLDPNEFWIAAEGARLRRSSRRYLIPDVCVIPVALFHRLRPTRAGRLAVFDEPLPFVAEVWSPSTGGYDASTKIPQYRLRGDVEIWFLHPNRRTLTVWRRQSEGGYAESTYQGGLVPVASLPGVRSTSTPCSTFGRSKGQCPGGFGIWRSRPITRGRSTTKPVPCRSMRPRMLISPSPTPRPSGSFMMAYCWTNRR